LTTTSPQAATPRAPGRWSRAPGQATTRAAGARRALPAGRRSHQARRRAGRRSRRGQGRRSRSGWEGRPGSGVARRRTGCAGGCRSSGGRRSSLGRPGVRVRRSQLLELARDLT
jgi:hypothetical protein